MSKIRQELVDMSRACEIECERFGWVSAARVSNFHLLYSSVESYEAGNRLVIMGINPSGVFEDANTEDRDRAFRDPGYNAYMDDEWREFSRGQSPFQRVIQAIAMILSGADPSQAMTAMNDMDLSPEERIGVDAETLLRNAPSGNIIPFRESTLAKMPKGLADHGERIGWQLLCLIRPRPHFIVTLANQVNRPPWRTILKNSGQFQRAEYTERIPTKMNRSYREARIARGPLKGALLVGLPAVVLDKGRRDVTKLVFDVLARRLKIHGLPCQR